MIYGKRIRLRRAEREDMARFVAWLNDPEVVQGLSQLLPLSQAEEELWYEKTLERPAEERPLTIEIRQEEGWHTIGNSGFHNLDWRNRSAEIGIFIGDKSYWNQGYGTETMQLLLEIAFDTLNLHRVYLRVFEDNSRAIRAYEKAGFVLEGRMRQAEFRRGTYRDVLLMSVLRTEWDPNLGA